jgi:regulator of cell morphogenesis and NO signaling
MLIHKDMKMAEVIHLNHHLLHLINRFGIQLGFGEKSVKDVCADYNVPLDFFLEIVNTFHDPTYFPLNNMLQFKSGALVDYLQKTHQYYLEFKIPEIEGYIERLLSDDSMEPEIKNLLSEFFQQYKSELTTHINKEEQAVYPYIRALEHFINNKGNESELVQRLKEYSIHDYEEDHDDVESKLFDLKNIIIKYIPKPKDSRILNVILHELFELEKDLNNHAHIEDLILVPIVEKMEKELMSRSDKRQTDA